MFYIDLTPPTLTLCTGVRGPSMRAPSMRGPSVRGDDISGWREPAGRSVSLTADTHCTLHTADCRLQTLTTDFPQFWCLNTGLLSVAWLAVSLVPLLLRPSLGKDTRIPQNK